MVPDQVDFVQDTRCGLEPGTKTHFPRLRNRPVLYLSDTAFPKSLLKSLVWNGFALRVRPLLTHKPARMLKKLEDW
jgi:hypothetical protein